MFMVEKMVASFFFLAGIMLGAPAIFAETIFDFFGRTMFFVVFSIAGAAISFDVFKKTRLRKNVFTKCHSCKEMKKGVDYLCKKCSEEQTSCLKNVC